MKTPNMVSFNRTNPTGAGPEPGKWKLDRHDAQTIFCLDGQIDSKNIQT